MKRAVLLSLTLAVTATPHRLDEYLQATLIGVTKNGIDVELRLTPGVAVLPVIMAAIDRDGDGKISPEEQRAYASLVTREVALQVDGAPVALSPTETTFPAPEEMREGLGAIVLKLRTARTGHALRFENHHLPQVSAYLVNCLANPAEGLTITHQQRDEAQKSIRLDYSFASDAAPGKLWPAAIAILLFSRMALLLYPRLNPTTSRPSQHESEASLR